jgi:hypothetical protein
MYYAYEIYKKDKIGSLVLGGMDSIDQCKEQALKDIRYYTQECGYEISATIESRCSTCHNLGTIKVYSKRNKLLYKTVKCPDCKNKFMPERWYYDLNIGQWIEIKL